MGFFVVVLLLAAATIVWQFIEGRKALATTSVITRYTPDQAVDAINGLFGGARSALWANASGPGLINRRRRGIHGGITLSIDITPQEDGLTRIDMWASQYAEYLIILVNFAGVVNRRKRAISRLLAEPDTQQPPYGRQPGQPDQHQPYQHQPYQQ